MNLNPSAQNMKAIVQARDRHDEGCPYGGSAQRVHLSHFDIERLGWEEGDNIAGLIVTGDDKIATGRMRVSCDAEPDEDLEEEGMEEIEITQAVAAERALVHVRRA